MATADQVVAREQMRHLRGRKRALQDELSTLQNAVVIARRQEIQDELAAINAQIDAINPRLPPPEEAQATNVSNSQIST